VTQFARLNDEILGMTAGEHSGHVPPHGPLVLTGFISAATSTKVFIKEIPVAIIGSITTEFDGCCGVSSGKVKTGSAKISIRGIPVARLGDEIDPHDGYANIITGSEKVWEDG
jgi:uncharacterized Zn-binding protein involved in type VI secretion